MIATAGRPGSALLAPLLRHWQGLLRSFNPAAPAILRISSGVAYITRARAEKIDVVVAQLLELCRPYLIRANLAVPETMLRAKILLEFRRPYAGLLLRLRYYGDPPTLDHAEWARRELGSRGVLLEPVAQDREVTLGVVFAEPERKQSLIHVRAGDQPLALPMTAVAKALSEQQTGSSAYPDQQFSLAECLGITVPGSTARPAWLQIKTPRGLQPLRVEALEGHGRAQVMPPGPLFLALPWCCGFIRSEEQTPVLVVDPWPLLLRLIQSEARGGGAT